MSIANRYMQKEAAPVPRKLPAKKSQPSKKSPPTAGKTSNVDIDGIRIDGGTQPRAGLDDEVVAEYAEAIKAGAAFPAVTVFYDGSQRWLADGFHRHAGHVAAGKRKISAAVLQGTRRDAILFSVGANAEHGLRRTNEDKRRAVTTMLTNPEVSTDPATGAPWSDREIARQCRVSNHLVASLRPKDTGNSPSMDRTFVHPKTGQPTTMDTSAIGKSAPEEAQPGAAAEPAPYDDDDFYDAAADAEEARRAAVLKTASPAASSNIASLSAPKNEAPSNSPPPPPPPQDDGPTYDEVQAAIGLLCDLKPEDFRRLCPPSKRGTMNQKLAHLINVFERVKEAAS